MAKVVKQGCETDDFLPRRERFAVGEQIHGWMTVSFVCDDVEDTASQLHHAERVFESAMRGSGVYEVCQRELMNVPEALKRPGVDGRNLVGGDTDKVMNRV